MENTDPTYLVARLKALQGLIDGLLSEVGRVPDMVSRASAAADSRKLADYAANLLRTIADLRDRQEAYHATLAGLAPTQQLAPIRDLVNS